ncbi:tetratricopeptide repeat protein [Pseudoalteromonas rubra]|uniref:tetratricopeptide repeat protein n=1 Tax=Pseudoalteromonas rubra TaxID=43658 RepID=UPI000F7B778C|nr:SEL1-like repeat protein [Pseudoalteromonas rubra]
MKFIVFFLFWFSLPLFASDIYSVTRSYQYTAFPNQEKYVSERLALNEMKLSVLQEVGTLVVSHLEIFTTNNGRKQFEEKTQLYTAGFIRADVLEKKWDGNELTLVADFSVNKDEIIRNISMIQSLKDESAGLLKLLTEAQKEINNTFVEIKSLKEQLNKVYGLEKKEALELSYLREKNRLAALDVFESALDSIYGRKGEVVNEVKGLSLLYESANRGIAQAYYILAILYFNGEVVRPSLKNMAFWAKKALDAGYMEALPLYIYQNPTPPDSEERLREAIKISEKAAPIRQTLEVTLADFLYRNKKNVKESLDLALPWAKKDDYMALNLVRTIYKEKGNPKKAKEWLEKAANLGIRSAQLELGLLKIDHGEQTEGFELIQLASEKRFIDASLNLYLCYYLGVGVNRDELRALQIKLEIEGIIREQAIESQAHSLHHAAVFIDSVHKRRREAVDPALDTLSWFISAASEGSKAAQIYLVNRYLRSSSAYDENKVLFWLGKAMEQNKADSAYLIGMAFAKISNNQFLGIKVADPHKARYWLHKAIAFGNKKARIGLASLYHSEGDLERLLSTLKDAATLDGDDIAFRTLIDYYEEEGDADNVEYWRELMDASRAEKSLN